MEDQPTGCRNPAWTSTTFILLCCCMVVDKADQIMLPAVFLQICQTFNSGPAFLGTITLCRGVAQSAVAVWCGPLTARFDRVKIVGWGCVGWGCACFGCGLAPTATALLFFRALNGVGLGLALPVISAIVSDLFRPHERGRAFGCVSFMNSFGGVVGGAFATVVAGGVVSGVAGWRFAFHVVGALSVLVGALLLAFGVDPPPNNDENALPHLKRKITWTLFWGEFQHVLKLKTFQVIIAQVRCFLSYPFFQNQSSC